MRRWLNGCSICVRQLIAWVVLALLVSTPSLCASDAGLPWIRSFAKALQLAEEQNKLIVADLYTDWCSWCVVMDRETLSHPSIVEQLGPRYVWLRLNTETEADGIAAQKRFRIWSYPVTVLIEPGEQLFETIEGYLPPEEFLEVVTSRSQALRALMELRDQVRSQPGNAQSKLQLARIYMERHESRLAAETYEALIRDNSLAELDECYYSLGLCLASQRREQRALHYLTLLRNRFPRSAFLADAMALEGQIRLNLGEKQKATRLWRDYLRRFPKHRMAQYIRSLLAGKVSASDRFNDRTQANVNEPRK